MARVMCFAILTNDPRSVCWAGGILEGKVTLDISTPLPVRGVRMTFYGEGRVEWTEGQPVTEMNRLTRPAKKVWRHLSTIHETEIYSKTTTILYGADPESAYMHVLPAGNHTMPFELPVPSDLPSSYEGCYGYVRYWLECVLDVVGHVEQITKKAFTVISRYNLNTDPIALKEIRRHEEVQVCCSCGSPGYYDIRYNVSRRGYVPGEKMMIDIRTRNFTNNTVHLTLRFKTVTIYHAKGKHVKVEKKLHEGVKTLESAETLKWNPEIPVPPLPPTGLGGSRVIDVRYWLELEISSEAYFADSIHFHDEIRIGTLPLDNITTAIPVTHQPSANHRIPGKPALLPIGYPTPEVRALPAPGHAYPDIKTRLSSEGSGGSANRFQAYNGNLPHLGQSDSMNSVRW